MLFVLEHPLRKETATFLGGDLMLLGVSNMFVVPGVFGIAPFGVNFEPIAPILRSPHPSG